MAKSIASHEDGSANTIFGFWVYLMTDCILFGVIFAVYAVLHNNTFGGPPAKEIFSIHFALAESMVLLVSSFTSGLAMLSTGPKDKKKVLFWFGITFILGASFLTMELIEFGILMQEGNGWQRSGFLSAYYTLVGTHGLHIAFGLLWMIVLLIPVMRRGLTPVSIKRLTCLKLFWHFLDVVWIFLFTVVYLMGAL
jgi:cytochrome o ubiquinol oxidase subunit III